ncbi:small secreted protein [Streptomyces griseorubiginosus]|uniref:small secreted protein n=1 Tax=Streptomyces griseorubiginosus TaxID=67304 RepID=UPI002E80E1E0|nr:small secreted protein [Streptomyces griseorubiginosus]WUB45284.1 small secreted protein [Streptomyces griseorubiginosus]WUB53801.1 small secreted protein [Streptomyces griseorubiginosus]
MEGTNPVNKKLAAALSGGAVLVLALSGCGGSEDNKELDAWAKKVCDLVPAQNKKITAAYDAITKAAEDTESTPAELQKADSQAFQDLSDGYKARATVIQDAGAPPGAEDGAKKLQDAVKQLTVLSGAYADMKAQVDKLDTKDQAKFATGLKDVSAEMQKVETQRQTALNALKELESGDTKQALADQSGCKQSPTSPAASAPATDS